MDVFFQYLQDVFGSIPRATELFVYKKLRLELHGIYNTDVFSPIPRRIVRRTFLLLHLPIEAPDSKCLFIKTKLIRGTGEKLRITRYGIGVLYACSIPFDAQSRWLERSVALFLKNVLFIKMLLKQTKKI